MAVAVPSPARASHDIPALLQRADTLGLASDPQWQALLHLEAGQVRVGDPGFLLSAADFSPEHELHATLQTLYGGAADSVCRFPARYAWLRTRLSAPSLDLARCDQLQEFLVRAPAQTVALAFASEHIAQPASMMGHVFLVLEGQAQEGQRRSHAISFYTDADTFNLPKLFFESLVTGKEGLFSLTPYADAQALYLRRERRALWTFTLGLDETDRQLVLFHLHELRSTHFRYFFQGYNCATLVKHVLAVARPEILQRHDPWTTPADVVRDAEAVGLVTAVSVQAPPRWRIGLLADALARPQRAAVQAAVREGTVTPTDRTTTQAGFLMLEMQRAYVEQRIEEAALEAPAGEQQLAALDLASRSRYPQAELHIGRTRDPRRAPGDTQVSFGWAYQNGERLAQVDLLPISHHLEDVQPPGNAETALSLLEVSLRQPLHGGGPRLHRFNLYAIESILPRDALAGGVSGKFRLGADDEDPAAPQRRLHGWLGGSIGYGWRPHRDIDLYGLVGGGAYGRGGWQLRTSQEVGTVVREAFGMKSVLSLTVHQHPREPLSHSTVWRLVQSKQLTKGWSVVLEARRTTAADARLEGSLLVRHAF